MYKFEKLKVWHEILKLIKLVYTVIKKLSSEERFGLADQIRRAVVSVALNLAEGCGSKSNREFCSFIKISLKSLYETVAAIKIVESLYPKIPIQEALGQAEIVGKMLHGLLRTVSNSK